MEIGHELLLGRLIGKLHLVQPTTNVRVWIFFYRIMYFSDWAEDIDKQDKAKIESSYMDGTNRTTIMDNSILWPNGLSLDLDKNRLYFCDAFYDTIYEMDLASGNVSVSLKLILC